MINQSKIPLISKQLYADEVLDILTTRYSEIGPQFTMQQLEWVNNIYKAFNDHDKFMIIIFLTKQTLDFYSKNFTKLTYDQFYLKDKIEIGRMNIIDISRSLNIPKESARRKIIELEKKGVILKNPKKNIIDRSAFKFIKPIESIKRMSRFLAMFSKMLAEDKILDKSINSEKIEETIKKNFSYVWKIYYEMQIPTVLQYKKMFGDIESWHIWGSCVVSQHFFSKKINKDTIERNEFLKNLTVFKMSGLNAMSISDITGIPRATVVRKLKKMVNLKMLSIDSKKHYKITENFVKKLMPFQKITLKNLSYFSTSIYNLSIL